MNRKKYHDTFRQKSFLNLRKLILHKKSILLFTFTFDISKLLFTFASAAYQIYFFN